MAAFTDRFVFRFYRRKRANPIVFAIVSVGVMFMMAGIIRIVIGPDDQSFAYGARFLISVREVTNKEFAEFRANHDSGSSVHVSLAADGNPVANVTWEDAIEYCNWLSQQEGLPPVYVERGGTWSGPIQVNGAEQEAYDAFGHVVALNDRHLVVGGTGADVESEIISFLREFSNYLTPKKGVLSIDTLTVASVYVRNTCLNLLVLVMALLVEIVSGIVLYITPPGRYAHWMYCDTTQAKDVRLSG